MLPTTRVLLSVRQPPGQVPQAPPEGHEHHREQDEPASDDPHHQQSLDRGLDLPERAQPQINAILL